jgi:hypothetical protein
MFGFPDRAFETAHLAGPLSAYFPGTFRVLSTHFPEAVS